MARSANEIGLLDAKIIRGGKKNCYANYEIVKVRIFYLTQGEIKYNIPVVEDYLNTF